MTRKEKEKITKMLARNGVRSFSAPKQGADQNPKYSQPTSREVDRPERGR